MGEDFVTVATLYSLAEAEPERLALEAAGIPTLATDESVGSLLVPNLVGGIKLQVPAADAARARDADRTEKGVPTACNVVRRCGRRRELQVPQLQGLRGCRFPSERRGRMEDSPRVRRFRGRAAGGSGVAE